MVGIQRESTAFYHVAKVADCFVGRMELPVVGAPFLLAGGQLLAKERKRLPSLGPALLDDGADGDLRCVGSDSEWEARVGVV